MDFQKEKKENHAVCTRWEDIITSIIRNNPIIYKYQELWSPESFIDRKDHSILSDRY